MIQVQTARNVRHDLDPAKVAAAVEKAIADHIKRCDYSMAQAEKFAAEYQQALADGKAHGWRQPPTTSETYARLRDEAIERERGYYAGVRVIELPDRAKRFVLAYGDVCDDEVTSGTGPFESIEAAGKWFYNGGR